MSSPNSEVRAVTRFQRWVCPGPSVTVAVLETQKMCEAIMLLGLMTLKVTPWVVWEGSEMKAVEAIGSDWFTP